MALKHQLIILGRSRKRAPNLKTWDRVLMGFWSLFIGPAGIGGISAVLSTATLFKFHTALKKGKYRRLFSARRQGKPGPTGPSRAVIATIVEMKRRNPRYGCRRIAQQIAKAFGIDLDKDVVRRVLAKHFRPTPGNGGSSWLTVIGHAKDSLWSLDLFRCESIVLTSHWVMVVMDQHTRRIIGFGVQAGDVTGASLCRMFNSAVAGSGLPKHLSTDNHPLFTYHHWKANLRILEVDEIKTVPYVPLSHPFVERLIGTIRREYLDQVFFWNATDLERKLNSFKTYYNDSRTHTALEGDTPTEISGCASTKPIDLHSFRWHRHCGGLAQLPVAA